METTTSPMNISGPQLDEYLSNFLDKDNLTDKWVLSGSPYPVMTIILIYYLFVLKIGPRFMENRRPYDLKNLMRAYNVFQVVANTKIIYFLIANTKVIPYIVRLSCSIPKETDEDIEDLKLVFLNHMHGYLVSKIMDLLDTVFMVLRKKSSHITFLHLYHHGVMVGGSWFTLNQLKSTQAIIPASINVSVHIVMYSYYFLSTFGDPVKKYLGWKKHLTKLQLAQFVVILIYISTLHYFECPISKKFTYFWLFNVFAILCLFFNFYLKAYIMRPRKYNKTS